MMEVAFWISLSNFVEIIHIQLHQKIIYLANKWWVIAVFEVAWENLLGEAFLIDYNEADSVFSPPNGGLIDGVLRDGWRSTESISKVFLRKLEMVFDFLRGADTNCSDITK